MGPGVHRSPDFHRDYSALARRARCVLRHDPLIQIARAGYAGAGEPARHPGHVLGKGEGGKYGTAQSLKLKLREVDRED